MVSTRRSSSSSKVSSPSSPPCSKRLKAENSQPKEVSSAQRDDVPESKDSASSSRDQLPSDPVATHAEDPAAAETPASSPDAAVEKPVATPPTASGCVPIEVDKSKGGASTWNRTKKRALNLDQLSAWGRLISQYPQSAWLAMYLFLCWI